MLTRIELKNFMSHDHTVIEPAPGLTVLIGPNNVGKSAIVAALQILCYNDNSTYVLRHGEKSCSVTVHTDDGHVVKWQRKNSASYEIDGQKFDRLGRDIPEELHCVLRLPKVDGNNKEEFDVHFGSQKSPIFLLDSPGATAARFFASSSDAIRLVQMQQRHKEKVRDAKRKKTDLEDQSAAVNRELEAIQPIIDIEPRIKNLEQLFEDIHKTEADCRTLAEYELAISEQMEIVLFHQAENTCLKALAQPPELEDTAPLSRTVEDLIRQSGQYHFAASQLEALHTLAPMPLLEDADTLAELIAETEAAHDLHTHAQAQLASLTQVDPPPVLRDCDPLAEVIEDLSTADASVTAYSELSKRLAELLAPPELSDVTHLEERIREIEQAGQNSARWEDELASLRGLASCDLQETDSLSHFLPVLEQAVGEVHRWQRAVRIMESLSEGPVYATPQALEELVGTINSQQESIASLEAELVGYTAEIEQVTAELRAVAQEETCPTCGGPIDVDRLLKHTAMEGEGR